MKYILDNSNKVIYIENKNVALRKATLDDLNDLYNNIWSDEDMAKYMLWQVSLDISNAKERLIRTINYQKDNLGFVITLKETNEVIGITGIYEYETNRYMEKGICISKQHRRKGYALEVLDMLLYMSFDIYKANDFLYSHVDYNNISKKLCEKYNFIYKETKQHIREYDNKTFNLKCYYLNKNSYINRSSI